MTTYVNITSTMYLVEPFLPPSPPVLALLPLPTFKWCPDDVIDDPITGNSIPDKCMLGPVEDILSLFM
jgi:hypothetical protein